MMFRLLTGEFPFGEGMMVPVNVQNRSRTNWPSFMSSNSQFAPLADSLKSVVDQCLEYDKSKRLTAAQVVQQCEDLCFNYRERMQGVVSEVIKARGFINTPTGKVFYHSRSVYGRNMPSVGSQVIFSTYPGSPFPRAHPIVVLSTNKKP
jgi:hypothetical protein